MTVIQSLSTKTANKDFHLCLLGLQMNSKKLQLNQGILNVNKEQDGPSLESSSYLNVSLRYLGPWDPLTLEPLDLGTLGPLPPTPPHTSSYHLLSFPPSLLLWYGIVMGGGSCDIG